MKSVESGSLDTDCAESGRPKLGSLDLSTRLETDVDGLRERVVSSLSAVRAVVPEPAAETLNIGDHRIDFLTSREMTPEFSDRIADYFRFIFNSDFPEFLGCQNCGWHQSAREIFSFGTDVNLPLSDSDKMTDFPSCPDCSGQTEFFHDPAKTKEKIREKFSSPAWMTLIRPQELDEIQGFNFGYEAPLRDVFSREWDHPFGYMANPVPDKYCDEAAFMDKICPAVERMQLHNNVEAEVTPDTKVLCWNCTAVGPGARDNHYLLIYLLHHFFNSMPPEVVNNMVTVGGVIKGSNYCKVFQRIRDPWEMIDDVLWGGQSVIVAPVKSAGKFFGDYAERLGQRAFAK